MPIDTRQYDSAADYVFDESKFHRLISNLSNKDDKVRLKTYMLWEDMYSNRPEHIRITLRGEDPEDSVQIYMPSAKKCIEAVNRYLGVNWQLVPDPNYEQSDALPEVAGMIDKIFKREKLKTKLSQAKRYMLIKGDSLLHIYADPFKPPGRRICIKELRPEHYFPIEDADGELIGVHIVDVIRNPKNTIRTRLHGFDEVCRRQTYRKELDLNGNPTGRISSELALWEIGKWDDRHLEKHELKQVEEIRSPYWLPNGINTIPVYHWANNPPPGSTFGLSELAGVESIVNAINQSMSDEDLTLIMQGLGVYWTDASPPLNERGEEVEWEISPRSVVQVASGGQFGRVSGITTVQPFGDHIKALDEAMQQALGVPDIAIGMVDVTTAESGIALELKLGPLLAKNREKEVDMLATADQFIYDLVSVWIPIYEKINTTGVLLINQFDDAMPKNKTQQLADLLSLWSQTSAVLPVAWFYQQLNEIMGYHLNPEQDFEAALDDAMAIADAQQGTPIEEPPPEDGDGATGESAMAGASANGQAKE